jgi:hypothetical protein
MTRVMDGIPVAMMSWSDDVCGLTCQMIREAFTAAGPPAPDLGPARP